MKDLSITQKRCLELARIIREGLPDMVFDMAYFRQPLVCCKTAGCIAGYATAMYAPKVWEHGDDGEIMVTAKKLLGLSGHQVFEMFHTRADATPQQAAAALENYALTGKVKWT